MEQRFILSFIDAADSVLASVLNDPVTVVELALNDAECFPVHSGFSAATVRVEGDIAGRVVLAVAPEAVESLSARMGGEMSAPEIIGELANMVVGNAVARLNDSGYRFVVHPPDVQAPLVTSPTAEHEAVWLRLESGGDTVHMMIAMRCAQQPAFAENP